MRQEEEKVKERDDVIIKLQEQVSKHNMCLYVHILLYESGNGTSKYSESSLSIRVCVYLVL